MDGVIRVHHEPRVEAFANTVPRLQLGVVLQALQPRGYTIWFASSVFTSDGRADVAYAKWEQVKKLFDATETCDAMVLPRGIPMDTFEYAEAISETGVYPLQPHYRQSLQEICEGVAPDAMWALVRFMHVIRDLRARTVVDRRFVYLQMVMRIQVVSDPVVWTVPVAQRGEVRHVPTPPRRARPTNTCALCMNRMVAGATVHTTGRLLPFNYCSEACLMADTTRGAQTNMKLVPVDHDSAKAIQRSLPAIDPVGAKLIEVHSDSGGGSDFVIILPPSLSFEHAARIADFLRHFNLVDTATFRRVVGDIPSDNPPGTHRHVSSLFVDSIRSDVQQALDAFATNMAVPQTDVHQTALAMMRINVSWATAFEYTRTENVVSSTRPRSDVICVVVHSRPDHIVIIDLTPRDAPPFDTSVPRRARSDATMPDMDSPHFPNTCRSCLKRCAPGTVMDDCDACGTAHYCSPPCKDAQIRYHVVSGECAWWKSGSSYTRKPLPTHSCGACERDLSVKKLGRMHCRACLREYYCSRECQVADWKSAHKRVCGKDIPCDACAIMIAPDSKRPHCRVHGKYFCGDECHRFHHRHYHGEDGDKKDAKPTEKASH